MRGAGCGMRACLAVLSTVALAEVEAFAEAGRRRGCAIFDTQSATVTARPFRSRALMNFGSLYIVTAWRLTKDGVMCQGIVMDGPEGVRLVVIEDQQIVEWQRFGRIFELRRHLRTVFKARRQAGWVPLVRGTEGGHLLMDANMPSSSRRRADVAPGLLHIAEQAPL